jgi:hypothetical protein
MEADLFDCRQDRAAYVEKVGRLFTASGFVARSPPRHTMRPSGQKSSNRGRRESYQHWLRQQTSVKMTGTIR